MSNNLEQYDAAPSTEARLRAIIAGQEAKLNEIADLAADVRHGINNPLAGIIGQVQILLRSDLPPDLRAQIESIEHLALRVRDTAALLRSIQRSPDTHDALNWPEK
jgi:signal transduction histidine kinase